MCSLVSPGILSSTVFIVGAWAAPGSQNSASIRSEALSQLVNQVGNSTNNTANQASASNFTVQGWTSSPNARGTLDIIWTCVTTIILCSWTAICLNVPPPQWGPWRSRGQKLIMTMLSQLGPEFIFHLALGQWAAARRSVADFRKSDYRGWTMKHAFFANMGGFTLHTTDFAPFPVTAKQVHYLVVNGHVDFRDVCLDPEVIEDKNKVDGLSRLIALVQVSWFSCSIIARLIQNLAITVMEIVTVGFIVCSLGTYWLWYHKPQDVSSAIPLRSRTSMKEILIDAGDRAREPYRDTPMDFVREDAYMWSLYFEWWISLCVRWFKIRFGPQRRPREMISDFYVPPLNGFWEQCAVMLGHYGYIAVHVSAWNLRFPTYAEKLIWHISSLMFLGTITVFYIWDRFYWFVRPHMHKQASWVFTNEKFAFNKTNGMIDSVRTPWRMRERVRNPSKNKDPSKDVPARMIVPLTFIAFWYCVARGYVLLEALLQLRALPLSAYQAVDWNAFVPHL